MTDKINLDWEIMEFDEENAAMASDKLVHFVVQYNVPTRIHLRKCREVINSLWTNSGPQDNLVLNEPVVLFDFHLLRQANGEPAEVVHFQPYPELGIAIVVVRMQMRGKGEERVAEDAIDRMREYAKENPDKYL